MIARQALCSCIYRGEASGTTTLYGYSLAAMLGREVVNRNPVHGRARHNGA